MSSDRNLLFGILAVQMNFISRDALISAMNAWVLSKEVPLGDLLQQQNALTTDRAQLLEAMVKEHLKTHENDPQKSLAALSSVESMREALLQVADPQVQRSLLAVVGHPSPVIDGTKVGPQDYQSVGSTRSFVSPDSSSRFRILRPHAKGGLGEVFVAEDTELHREVALKEIQGQHAHNENSRGRFILEAEVTGGLEHPNIVPVYGLGTYADGRPYYAMRFIRGDSLKEAIERFYKTTYPNASERNLAFRNLLKRFVDVCNAIAYAHSRGILHRDLKPGNIMLGKYGETLVVDWGLAKAVGGGSRDGIDENAERTLNPSGSSYAETLAGSAIGTPAFMSPEQAAGRLDQLGPASDVYSLGATLYVLLTGELPFKPSDSILKQVEEGEFPAPMQVRSDIPLPLNAIVLKAMAKKMENRYLTATALAEEVEHYLADESVTAYREPMAERTKRWARKHPGMVAGVAATLMVGVLGLVVGSVVLREKNEELASSNKSLDVAVKEAKENAEKAIRERDEKEKQRKRAEDQEKKTNLERIRAEQEKSVAFAVRDFLQNSLLRQASAWEQANRQHASKGEMTKVKSDITVRELLDRAAEEFSIATIDKKFPKKFDVQTEILDTIGEAYEGTGYYDKAAAFLKASYVIREKHLGANHSSTLVSLINLACINLMAGQRTEAITQISTLLSRLDSILTEAAKNSSNSQAQSAEAIMDAMFKATERQLHPSRMRQLVVDPDFAETAVLGLQLMSALPKLERIVKYSEIQFGTKSVRTWLPKVVLGFCYYGVGQSKRATSIFKDVLKEAEPHLELNSMFLTSLREILAHTYLIQDINTEEVVQLFEKAVSSLRMELGEQHPTTLGMKYNLALAYVRVNMHDKALLLLEEVLKIQMKQLGPDHPETLFTLKTLANHSNDFSRKIPLLEQAMAIEKGRFGTDSEITLSTKRTLANWYHLFDFDKAEKLYVEYMNDISRTLGNKSISYAHEANKVAYDLLQMKKFATAELYLRQSVKIHQEKENSSATNFTAMSLLGKALLGQKKLEEVEPLLLKSIQGTKQLIGNHKITSSSDNPTILRYYELMTSIERLIQYYTLTNRPHEITKWINELIIMSPSENYHINRIATDLLQAKQYLGAQAAFSHCLSTNLKSEPNAFTTFEVMSQLGEALTGIKRMEEAERLLKRSYEGMNVRLSEIPPETVDKQLYYLDKMEVAGNRLIQFYTVLEKPDASKYWQSEVMTLSIRMTNAVDQFVLELSRAQKVNGAEATLKQCLEMRQISRANTWATFVIMSKLGHLLVLQKKHSEAEPLLLKSYEGMKVCYEKTPGADAARLAMQQRLPEAIDRLIQFYTETNKPDEVKKWKAEKEKLPKPLPAKK